MMHVFFLRAPLQKNQVNNLIIASIQSWTNHYPPSMIRLLIMDNLIVDSRIVLDKALSTLCLGGLLIMDTAVEEDTEEERKMPLAIMQGYMTIIQVCYRMIQSF